MKKKLFTLALTTIIIFSAQSTLALDGNNQSSTNTSASSTAEPATAPADNAVLNLSLEDALKLMETGNKELELADSKLLIYEKQNEQALARRTDVTVVDEESRKTRDLNHKRTQWTLDNAKHDRETQIKELKAQITNEYQNILALQQQADNLKTQLGNLETIIDQVNLQIELGLKVPTDIYTYNAQKSKLEAAQNAIMNSIKSSMITLKQDLGIDINRNVVLTATPIQYTKFDDSDIDNQIAKAIQNHYDIQKYEQDIEITQIQYDIEFFYDNILADQVQLSIEDKKATLAMLPVQMEVDLRTAYNTIKTLENTIEADKLTVEADQININIMQKNIEAGKSSGLEMIPLQNTLLNDQYTLQQDINAYMMAVTNFRNSLENHSLNESTEE
ncbi:MAG: TolC family protein [Clostridia bacterium]|nr:TolC family protein [Clostridia bacterium]